MYNVARHYFGLMVYTNENRRARNIILIKN